MPRSRATRSSLARASTRDRSGGVSAAAASRSTGKLRRNQGRNRLARESGPRATERRKTPPMCARNSSARCRLLPASRDGDVFFASGAHVVAETARSVRRLSNGARGGGAAKRPRRSTDRAHGPIRESLAKSRTGFGFLSALATVTPAVRPPPSRDSAIPWTKRRDEAESRFPSRRRPPRRRQGRGIGVALRHRVEVAFSMRPAEAAGPSESAYAGGDAMRKSRATRSSFARSRASARTAGAPEAAASRWTGKSRNTHASVRGENPASFRGASETARTRSSPDATSASTSSRSRISERPRSAQSLLTRISCGVSTRIESSPRRATCGRSIDGTGSATRSRTTDDSASLTRYR